MEFELVVEEMYKVGKPIVFEATSADQKFTTVFEDDGETGYFYALDMANKENPIVDALHIYNVKDVVDKEIPSEVQIIWSKDSAVSILYVNNYSHAMFDFKNKSGYCRTNFPPPGEGDWSKDGHEWNQEYYEELFPAVS